MSGRAATPPGELTKRVAAVLRARKGELQVSDRQIADAIGVSQEQVSRFLRPSRVMTLEQTEAICRFLGLDLSATLRGERVATVSGVTPPKSDDPRTLIMWLLANPSQDEELNNRLSEAFASGEFRGSALTQIQETIRDVRRNELVNALAALPPSAGQGGNRQSG